jgi:hypothetical protein
MTKYFCSKCERPFESSAQREICKICSKLEWLYGRHNFEYLFEEDLLDKEKHCREYSCNNLIEFAEQHCYKHLPKANEWYCNINKAYKDKECYQKISKKDLFCSPCKKILYHENVCSYYSCSREGWKDIDYGRLELQELINGQIYCYKHYKSCLSCSQVITIDKNYCFVHHQEYQKQQQEKLKLNSLVEQKTSLANIQEVVRFETWWNKNCATAINKNNGYWVFLIVYEPETKNIGEVIRAFPPNHFSESYWGDSGKLRKKHSNLTTAKNEAFWLINQLTNQGKHYDNPILLIHPNCNNYVSFSEIIKEPYVTKSVLPYEEKIHYDLYDREYKTEKIPTKEPNRYLKPLDIVKSDMAGYYHVGIYLGNNLVCHFTKEHNNARIDWWSNFIEGNVDGKLIRYHPIIPFKHYSKVVQQIAWTEEIKFRKDCYDLGSRNCEHFANMIGFGINYSKQIEKNRKLLERSHHFARGFFAPLTFGLSLTVEKSFNDNKGSTIKLINEISETNNKLGWTINYRSKQLEARIEIPPKQECRIM